MPVESTPVAAAPVAAAAPVVTPPAQEPVVVPVVTPAAPVVAVPNPDIIPVPKALYEEFQGYKNTVAKLEADRQAAEAAKKELEIKAQIKDGQFEEVLKNYRAETEKTTAAERSQRALAEKRAEKYALQSELSAALARPDIVSGGAAQLHALWEKEFVVEAAGDSFAVRTPAFQSVKDFVAAKLASTEYSHFVRATNPNGGVGANPGASLTVPTPSSTPVVENAPKNLGEQLRQMQQSATSHSVVNNSSPSFLRAPAGYVRPNGR